MVVLGRVRSGAIVIEGEIDLPEGARVRIEVLNHLEPKNEENESQLTLFERLKDVAGIAKGLLADLAAQHDHYIHGQPKR
jgi:hypothetical protein